MAGGWRRLSILAVATFDLDAYLSARRSAVDRALERYLTKPSGCAQALRQAMRYGLFPGGKRIRPILTLAAGEIFGGKRKELLPFACAIEMIHAYSLIHDDLPAMDDDDLRRGMPTAHKVFGEGMALLAGDGLLTEAFHLISGPATRSLDPELVLELIHELGCAAGVAGLVGGQSTDLEAEDHKVDRAMVESMHGRKTGALIIASLKIGARAGGAKPAELKRISRYGEAVGLAFQIADDILDGADEEARHESGRKEAKKATYPSVVGVARARERLSDLTRQAMESLAPFGARAEPLRAIAGYVAERALET
ncbi:MAG TPA: farnesyl diphosphate synthase [Candidatus Binatia bacterium]